MKTPYPKIALVSAAWMALGLAEMLADGSAPGVTIEHPSSEWKIEMTAEGYSDLAFDKRPGYEGREYLSGEWAAAIHYGGGSMPTEAIWFRERFAAPCWVSNSNFTVTQPVILDSPAANPEGSPRYFSKIANDDVEITIRYEMIDTGVGIAQGEVRDSDGGAGMSSLSTRFVLKQTYEIKNISDGELADVKLYQFLHGLNTGIALQDNRDYGGVLGDYHYDCSQRGTIRSFNTVDQAIYSHIDTVTMHAREAPDAFEVGYYGKAGVDDHNISKPSEGVHLSVEAHSLSGLDFFDPPEERWVSGAMEFGLADLAPGASVGMDVLLSLDTVTAFVAPPINLDITSRGLNSAGDEFVVDFQEMTNAPVDLFVLRRSVNNHPGDAREDWMDVDAISFQDSIGGATLRSAVTAGAVRQFFHIEARLVE